MFFIVVINFVRVRLYVNVPGSLIVAGNSKRPIRKPPSSTKMEPAASIEIRTPDDVQAEGATKMTASGTISL